MEMKRRDFLQLAAAGAAGALLKPGEAGAQKSINLVYVRPGYKGQTA